MNADELFHLFQPLPLSDADIDRMACDDASDFPPDEEAREIPDMIPCRWCGGSGVQQISGLRYPCEDCGGSGVVPSPNPHDD